MIADVLTGAGFGDTKAAVADSKQVFTRKLGLLRHPPAVSYDNIIFEALPLPASKDGKTYAAEVAPLLPAIHEAFLEAQAADSGNPIWNNLKLHLSRISFNQPGVAPISIREIYERERDYWNEDTSGHQIFIDIRRFAKPKLTAEQQKDSLKTALLKKLSALSSQKEKSGSQRLLPPAINTDALPLETHSRINSLTGGYDLLQVYQDSLPSEKRKEQLTATATAPKLIDYVARSALGLRSQFGEIQIVEIGAFDGRGIKELLAATHQISGTDLREFLIYLSDPSSVGLHKAQQDLAPIDKFGASLYFVQDNLDIHPLENLKAQGFNGRGYMFRANNVLDALPSNFIAKLNGEPYKVVTKTVLNIEALTERLKNTVRYHADESDQELIPAAQGISAEYFLQKLSQIPARAAEEIVRDLKHDFYISQEAAMQIWAETLPFIVRDVSYVKITDWREYSWATTSDGRNLNHVLERAFRDIPEGFLMPDNVVAANLFLNYLPAIHRGGHMIATQLTCGHDSYQGPRTLGITRAQGLYAPLFEILVRELGHGIKWISAKEFGHTPNSATFDITVN